MPAAEKRAPLYQRDTRPSETTRACDSVHAWLYSCTGNNTMDGHLTARQMLQTNLCVAKHDGCRDKLLCSKVYLQKPVNADALLRLFSDGLIAHNVRSQSFVLS
jgi:hypothetical protein